MPSLWIRLLVFLDHTCKAKTGQHSSLTTALHGTPNEHRVEGSMRGKTCRGGCRKTTIFQASPDTRCFTCLTLPTGFLSIRPPLSPSNSYFNESINRRQETWISVPALLCQLLRVAFLAPSCSLRTIMKG